MSDTGREISPVAEVYTERKRERQSGTGFSLGSCPAPGSSDCFDSYIIILLTPRERVRERESSPMLEDRPVDASESLDILLMCRVAAVAWKKKRAPVYKSDYSGAFFTCIRPVATSEQPSVQICQRGV